MMEELITIPFEIGEGDLVYRDSIVIPKSLYDTMSEAEIEAEKQARYDNWLNILAEL